MKQDENAFEWKDEYCIGVDSVDRAHRQLFRIVSRIIGNFEDFDFERNKATCIEAVKYLKDYAVQHFADEEEYMLDIGYPEFSVHKQIHDNMRTVVIPAHEDEMVKKDFSKESIENFLGMCAGWLTAHILIDDAAIAGKIKPKWKSTDEHSIRVLNELIKGFSANLFDMKAEVISRHYHGDKLDQLFVHMDTFEAPDGVIFAVSTAMEYSMLEVIARRFVKTHVFDLDKVMQSMLSELLSSFNKEIIMTFLQGAPKVIGSKDVATKNFYAEYDKEYPDYSMLWKTYCGRFAFTIRKDIVVNN